MKFILLLCLIACASAKNTTIKEMTIRPGEIRWIELEIPNNEIKLFCRDRELKVSKKGNKVQAVVIESYFSDMRPFVCTFKDKDKVLADIYFNVEKREYKAEKLRVDPKRIKLSKKDQKRADEEQIILNKIYAGSKNEFNFDKSFEIPMGSLVTSVYGTKRVYNKQKKGQHLGIDFRAAIGDKVPTTNSGTVVFAGDLFYTGFTVIVDHGMDIFSVYGHLSKPLVTAGQRVERGEVLGLSGNTGRTSGPHLHWGMKVQGEYIDGINIIDESKKVFKE